jgi:hypothetical protein
MQTAEISATGRAQVEQIALAVAISRAPAVETAKRLTEVRVDSTGRRRATTAAAELRAWDREGVEASAAAVVADVEEDADDWHTKRGKHSSKRRQETDPRA